jgi:alpha-beta hydrolase superfamily lysophospholipase
MRVRPLNRGLPAGRLWWLDMRRLAVFALLFGAVAALVAACDEHGIEPPPPTPTGQAVAAPPTAGRLGVPTGVRHTAASPAFAALPGATAHTGQLGAAMYRIEMPDEWNGSVVLWAHGFRGFGTELTAGIPPAPLRRLFIEQGYAWAASSYSENGYVPGIGADDTLALKRHFAQEFGEPEYTYIGGESMGGNVVALSLERLAGEYDGGLALCGATGGQEQIDYLVSWAALAEVLSGAQVPFGAPREVIGMSVLTDVLPALGPVDRPTARGRQFASAIRELTGGARPFFAEGFAEQYNLNFAFLAIDPNRETPLASAATNEGVTYAIDESLGVSAAALNERVRRFEADASVRDASAYPDRVPTSGRLTAPMLVLHGTGDLFVPISHAVAYQRKAQEAGASDLLVQRAIRSGGHCEFSAEEVTAAWGDLRAWVEAGARPQGDDLSGDLSDIGRRFTTPLRPGDPGGR